MGHEMGTRRGVSGAVGRDGGAVTAAIVMSEINVTPMVDVMLVLLIIFMVSAPLLTVGVPIDLPQTQAKSLDQDSEPLTLSVNTRARCSCRTAKSRSTTWSPSSRR